MAEVGRFLNQVWYRGICASAFILQDQEMAVKLEFKIFAALLVMVPIIIMFSANYYRQVSSPKKRMDWKLKPIDGLLSNRNDLSHQAQVLYKIKSASPVETVGIQNISPGPEFYEMLKERKTYELRMEKSMQESWRYIRSQLEMLKSGKIPTASKLTDTLNSMNNQYSYARKWYRELKHSGSTDSTVQLNWQYWQKNVSMEMQSLVQKRLFRLQNPKDCNTARKLLCKVDHRSGFGSQMHHISFCFILAYASERTLVLESSEWRHSAKAKGWDSVFLPVSPCQVPATGKYVNEAVLFVVATVHSQRRHRIAGYFRGVYISRTANSILVRENEWRY